MPSSVSPSARACACTPAPAPRGSSPLRAPPSAEPGPRDPGRSGTPRGSGDPRCREPRCERPTGATAPCAPMSSSPPRTSITWRPLCCRARCRPTRNRGGGGARAAPAPCWCCSACGASCRSCSTTPCSSRATGTRTSGRSARDASPPRPRPTCADPRRPIRRSRRPVTRTCSCWSPCRRTRRWVTAARTGPAPPPSSASPTRRSPGSPSRLGSPTSPSASWCAARSVRPSSPRISGPGGAACSARPTPCGRAPSSAPATPPAG